MRASRIAIALGSIAGGYIGAFYALFPRAADAISRRLLGG